MVRRIADERIRVHYGVALVVVVHHCLLVESHVHRNADPDILEGQILLVYPGSYRLAGGIGFFHRHEVGIGLGQLRFVLP